MFISFASRWLSDQALPSNADVFVISYRPPASSVLYDCLRSSNKVTVLNVITYVAYALFGSSLEQSSI